MFSPGNELLFLAKPLSGYDECECIAYSSAAG